MSRIIFLFTVIFVLFAYAENKTSTNKSLKVFYYNQIKINSDNIVLNKKTNKPINGKLIYNDSEFTILENGLILLVHTNEMMTHFDKKEPSIIELNSPDLQYTINIKNGKMVGYIVNDIKKRTNTFIKLDNNGKISYIKEIHKSKNLYKVFSNNILDYYNLENNKLINEYKDKNIITLFLFQHKMFVNVLGGTIMKNYSYNTFITSIKADLNKTNP